MSAEVIVTATEAAGERTRIGEKPSAKPRTRGVCDGCRVTGNTLVMPERLPYDEAKAYKGPMYCLSCAPRFKALPRIDFERLVWWQTTATGKAAQ